MKHLLNKSWLGYYLSQLKWFRKWHGGNWYYVVAYYEFQYWTNHKPFMNEHVRKIEVY